MRGRRRLRADANNKYVTTYFRTSFYAANVGSFTGALLRLLRDDGAVVTSTA